MMNRRMLLASVLALVGTGALLAQTPPPSGLFPASASAPEPVPANGPGAAPLVAIGDEASSNVPKLWYGLGWAYYWTTPTPNPSPLVTTSDPLDAGVLGAPTTVRLLGQQTLSYGGFNGVTFTSGGWWNEERTIGMSGFAVWSEQRAVHALFESDFDGNPPLFRPILDPVLIGEASRPISTPGQVAGSFVFESRMRFSNGDTNLMLNAYRDETRSVTALLGYRLAYIREEMRMIQNSIFLQDGVGFFLGQPLLAGDVLRISDRIETVNRYLVGQIGLRWDRFAGPVNLTFTTKLGIGWSNQRIYGDGRTTLEPDVETAAGGLLVQRSFPDRNQLEKFAFVPELGIAARVRVLRRLHATFSYQATYFSTVARPGKYIDRFVELNQVPSSNQFNGVVGTRPAFIENDSDMFIHGFSAGLTWVY